MNRFLLKIGALTAALFAVTQVINAGTAAETALESTIEILDVDILSYADFTAGDPSTIAILKKALYEKGIVGIKSVPGYKEKVTHFIQRAKEFSALPDEVKHSYAPNRKAGEFLGYEIGKEMFLRSDGTWVPDDSKSSYYALVPESPINKWPVECDLQAPFEEMGQLMLQTGKEVVAAIGLIGADSPISLDALRGVGRMLHYVKQSDETMENPLWCGAHFDHGFFTALLPGFYFVDGEQIPEPYEAGLFVRVEAGKAFRKVVSNDPDVLLFQVGEFGQLATDDGIKATEHRVHKARGGVERYTLALFFSPPMDTIIRSHSELVSDTRYGGVPGDGCSYGHWHEESLKRYHVDDKKEVSD